jgi:hypothetical protein
MTEALLKQHADKEDNPAIMRLMARGMLKDLQKGKLDNMLPIYNRVFPAPPPQFNQQVNIQNNADSGKREIVVVHRRIERLQKDGSAGDDLDQLPQDYTELARQIMDQDESE